MKGRNSQVARIVKIIIWLENSKFGLTTKEIHDRLEEFSIKASLRTIYRDIEAIQQSGVPLVEENCKSQNNTKKWFLKKDESYKSSSRLTDREYLMLLFARHSILPSVKNELQAVYANTLSFAEMQLTAKEKNHMKEIELVVEFEEGFLPNYYIDLNKIENVLIACMDEIEIAEAGRTFVPKKIVFGKACVAFN